MEDGQATMRRSLVEDGQGTIRRSMVEDGQATIRRSMIEDGSGTLRRRDFEDGGGTLRRRDIEDGVPPHRRSHHASPDRVMDLASHVFDPRMVPERPKSACDDPMLLAQHAAERAAYVQQRSYSRENSAERQQQHGGLRISAEHLAELAQYIVRSREGSRDNSRDNSLGRARSAEREAAGIRTPKAVAMPRVPTNASSAAGHGELSLGEVKAIIHAEAAAAATRPIYHIATVPRRQAHKKENIYENVPLQYDPRAVRPVFRKQSSLDALPSESRRAQTLGRPRPADSAAVGGAGRGRGGAARGYSTLRKADSFEGHEEAVKTLVAAVQETRILRCKKPK